MLYKENLPRGHLCTDLSIGTEETLPSKDGSASHRIKTKNRKICSCQWDRKAFLYFIEYAYRKIGAPKYSAVHYMGITKNK